MPGLDSVVRFDGEMTLVNLLNCLGDRLGLAWHYLASRSARTIMKSLLRPLAPRGRGSRHFTVAGSRVD